MTRRIPYSQRCECGQRVEYGKGSCAGCRRRRERSFAVPGRDVASLPSKVASGAKNRRNGYPEAEQDRDLKELSRCAECGTPYGGHSFECSFWHFVDTTEEYVSPGGDDL